MQYIHAVFEENKIRSYIIQGVCICSTSVTAVSQVFAAYVMYMKLLY